ncbi:unnamed protein product [Penicillium salamii]|nr:unnamed protein product [Penicillium salamii]CAG8406615.1 unnamed protein product [Penicillium salamii]
MDRSSRSMKPSYFFLNGSLAGKKIWFDEGFYPVPERLLSGFQGGVLLVDVGGGWGQEAEAFAKIYGGRVILQDLECVTASGLTEDRNFETQAHDFFTPQPVVGARAYHLHSILHGWNDEDAVRILNNLVPALKKGYSRVLVNE